jgi:glutamate synthase domain-containing protein 2/glutamate synthase domain-containing protein 1
VEAVIRAEGQELLGWRDVPVHPEKIGHLARLSMPTIRQVFIGRSAAIPDPEAFERKLYVIRKQIQQRLWHEQEHHDFFACSFSSRTIVYKGLLLGPQIEPFYADLRDERFVSALALVHQRYSTNTWPTWDLAQPFRTLCHNGEINTLRGNGNWMRARQAIMDSPLFGEDLPKLFPLIRDGASDSNQIDNALEFLLLSGRTLPHAMMMLIPEAWDRDPLMSDEKKAFYEYNGCMQEPWDGPASIPFTDGTRIGAVLDRNGLRPSRYVVTKDDFVVMASEVGVLPIEPADVKYKGRLQPGRMFLVDTEQGRIIDDAELKREYASRRPYRAWLDANRTTLHDLPETAPTYQPDPDTRRTRQHMFGYTLEDLRILLAPMIPNAREADGSMGNDTPLACLSERPSLVFQYFKQIFAQVTNPAIDSVREDSVMSLISTLGEERNPLAETPEHARLLRLDQPILADEELERIRRIAHPSFRSATLSMVWKTNGDLGTSLASAIARLRREASEAVRGGANILILSDREAGPDAIPIPSLLAVSAVHHHLIGEGIRMKCGLAVETGEAREVGHFALLIAYGAAAINPYLALETIHEIVDDGSFIPAEIDREAAVKSYVKAIGKGLLKIFAKMGISTLASYRGAQIVEAVGIAREVVDEYFAGTVSRIGGVDLETIAREAQMRHERAFPSSIDSEAELDVGGEYQWRRGGERHLFSPETVHRLQQAVRTGSYATYKRYAEAINDQTREQFTIRGLLRFRSDREPIPLDEVESTEAVMKRFCTGAMSFGSISAEAHETLAIAMNRIGGKSNSGEGGEDSARYVPDPSGDLRRSAIKQVASGRFGVTSWYLTNADELQIKIAQGAKPGEGGQLPGHKVDRNIARVRHSTPGVGLISPPPHHDIYSIEDLAQLIHDLKNSNPSADVSVKLVAVSGVGTIAAGVSKGHAETVLVVGHDGGTGASPQTSIKHAGVPWEIGLSETQQVLVLNDLRGRIRVHVDGQLRTGRDVGRRRVRVRNRRARHAGLHHDARLPSEHLSGRGGHAGRAAAREVRRQGGARRELLPLRGRGRARDHGGARLPHARRADRSRRPAGARPRHPPLEAPGGPRFRGDPPPAGAALPGRAHPPDPRPGPRPRVRARPRADPALRAGARAGGEGLVRDPDPEREPHRGDHARPRALPAARGAGPPGRHDPDPAARLGRPELRSLPAPGNHAHAGGRRQRLHRQGALGRAPDRASPPRVHVRSRREHRGGQRRLLRGHGGRDLLQRRGGRAVLRAEQRRARGGRGGRGPRLRVHDGRACGDPGADRLQLRGGNERRHRLGLGPGEPPPRAHEPGPGGARAGRGRGPRRRALRADPEALRLHE